MPDDTGDVRYDYIIAAGRKIFLRKDLDPNPGEPWVITFDHNHPAALSFPRKREDTMRDKGKRLYGGRHLNHVAIPHDDLERLAETVWQVVIHTDLTGDASKCFQTLWQRGLSTHFMVDWDGTIYQGLDPGYQAFHAGEANWHSVGVDMNNLMRNLKNQPDSKPYPPRGHPRYDERMDKTRFKRPISPMATINYSKVKSYGYTDPQYQSLIALLTALRTVFPKIEPQPPMDETGEVINRSVEKGLGFHGFIGHYQLTGNRWDPGPGFDWKRVMYGLSSERNAMPVPIAGGNISEFDDEKKVRAQAAKYHAMVEGNPDGGWYPIGPNQTWHGGVHMKAPKGTDVVAMVAGTLVAVRMGRNETPLGSNNFMVLRHAIKIPTRRKGKSNELVFYSLYMHLDYLDPSVLKEDTPNWLRQLHERAKSDDEEDAAALEVDEEEDEDAPKKKKKRKKRKKKTSKDEDKDKDKAEDADGDEEGADPDDEDADEFSVLEEDRYDPDKRPYLEVGKGLAALKRGKVALVPYDEEEMKPIYIGAGDVLSKIGRFGAPDVSEPMVHVEIFADASWKEAIDLGLNRRHFVEVSSDLKSDLFVKTRDILNVFGQQPRRRRGGGGLVPARSLSSSQIRDFFNEATDNVEARRWLRKVVARHVSEWSDQVDWVKALSDAETWDLRTKDLYKVVKESGIFKGALRQVMPYVWLTKETAEHIGLDTEAWSGILYHFNPIHFVLWLTFYSNNRIKVLSRGKSLRKIQKERKAEKIRLRKLRAKNLLEERDDGDAAALDLEEVDEADVSELMRSWFERADMGDWALEIDDPDE